MGDPELIRDLFYFPSYHKEGKGGNFIKTSFSLNSTRGRPQKTMVASFNDLFVLYVSLLVFFYLFILFFLLAYSSARRLLFTPCLHSKKTQSLLKRM